MNSSNAVGQGSRQECKEVVVVQRHSSPVVESDIRSIKVPLEFISFTEIYSVYLEI